MTNFLQPYNPEWKTEFERLKSVLTIALKDFTIDIQHVGSTPIPYLYAKPILDMDIIIFDEVHLTGISAILEKLGYISKGEQGIAGRFAFRQSSNLTPFTGGAKQWQEHHLYVCFSNCLALKNHLLFRDTLLQDKKLADEYSQLKIRLTKEAGMTREGYTKQKTQFILDVLACNGLEEEELNEIKRVNL